MQAGLNTRPCSISVNKSIQTIQTDGQLARPLKVLAPLIKVDLTAIKQAEADAGIEHKIACGEKLNEAKSQCGRGHFYDWLRHNFHLTIHTARFYMKMAKATKADVDLRFDSQTEFRKKTEPKFRQTIRPPDWHEPVKRIIDNAASDRFFQRIREGKQEDKLVRDLELKIIDAGFKVLSIKLHPDKGGSADAMRRPTEARTRLKECVG
jgi:hypothetical protein